MGAAVLPGNERERFFIKLAVAIETKLNQAFRPERLSVVDDSAAHAGHAGARPGGESHFTVEIVSAAFEGKSRVERHRMVNAALAEELSGGIHALLVKAKAPGE